ncbi:MAG: hypothetical protein RL678_1511, partial [Pseudomonadota bacterium]
MIHTSAENTSAQTVFEALAIMKDANRNNQRMKVNAEGNIYAINKPDNRIGKFIYAAKLKLSGKSDTAEVMVALLKKMESEVGQASSYVKKLFSENTEKFRRIGRSGNLNQLADDWTPFAINIHAHSDREIQDALFEKSDAPRFAEFNSVVAEPVQGTTIRSANTRGFGHAQSLEIMQRNLVTIHQLKPEEAASFAQEVDDVLRDLKCNFREFSDFERRLLLNPQFPTKLSKKTEISLALAMLPELKQGKPASELAGMIGPRLGALQLVQAELPTMKLRESLSFAKEISDRLSEVGFEFYEFGAFKDDLLRNKHIPNNLPKKTEISAAIAIIQQKNDNRSLDEAAKLINARLSSISLIQQHVPAEIKIDCVHERMVFRDPGNMTSDAHKLLRTSLQSMKQYPNTTDPKVLATHASLGKLENQFGKDFTRNPAVLKKNGEVDQYMKAATEAMKDAHRNLSSKDVIPASTVNDPENQWLNQFIKFFGDDNVAKVASHYLSQTMFGSLSDVCSKVKHSWVEPVEEDHHKRIPAVAIYSADLVGEEGQEKLLIRASLSKFGTDLAVLNFNAESYPEKLSKAVQGVDFLPLVSSPNSTSFNAPSTTDLTIELDVNEMKRLVF